MRGPLRRHVRSLMLLILLMLLMLLLMLLMLLLMLMGLRARVFIALDGVFVSFPSRRPFIFAL